METNKQEKEKTFADQVNHRSLSQKIENVIDSDLLDADRGYNLKAAKDILHAVSNVAEIVEDAIEDIHMHLGEHRAKILSTVFSKIPGVYNIEWNERGVIKICSMFPFDESVVMEVQHAIRTEHSELEIDLIMDEPRVLNTDSSVLSWRWVG